MPLASPDRPTRRCHLSPAAPWIRLSSLYLQRLGTFPIPVRGFSTQSTKGLDQGCTKAKPSFELPFVFSRRRVWHFPASTVEDAPTESGCLQPRLGAKMLFRYLMLKKDYTSLVEYTSKEVSFFGISMYFVAHFQELKNAWKVEGTATAMSGRCKTKISQQGNHRKSCLGTSFVRMRRRTWSFMAKQRPLPQQLPQFKAESQDKGWTHKTVHEVTWPKH